MILFKFKVLIPHRTLIIATWRWTRTRFTWVHTILLFLLNKVQLFQFILAQLIQRLLASFLQQTFFLFVHYKIILIIQIYASVVLFRLKLFQFFQQITGEFFSLKTSRFPDLWEVIPGHSVLGHSDGICDINDGMPPASGYIDGLSWALNEF